MNPQLRAGIIGTGFMSGVHAQAIRTAGGTVTRVAGSSQASGDAFARRIGAESAVATVDALIGSDDVDVVHICTPNNTHAELALKAIKAGKAVVCEKPLATSVADAQALSAAADAGGTITAVPFIYRFYPAVREARARILAGEGGNLWLLHGSYLQDWLSADDATNWRVNPELGGGSRAFGDIGVHWCDLMEFVTGHRIVRLISTMSNAFPRRVPEGDMKTVTTEDGANILFETDQGASGSLVISQVSPGRKNRLWFSFDGTKASYSFDQENPGNLWIGGSRSTQILPSGNDSLGASASAEYAFLPAGHPQGYQDCFNAFVGDMHAAVRGERPEGLPSFADGLRSAQLTEAVLTSAASRSWTDIPLPVTAHSYQSIS